MTYANATKIDAIELVMSMTEDQFYDLIAESNANDDYAFSAKVMKAQSDLRRAGKINY
ncbi:hypothetical protein phiST2_0049 [Vibrio phage phi-ST2]|uniref:Uncharacterized protein n=2 Tax=Schizotequatrovirus TaxID=1198137 RepID=A0A140B3M7_9CAUD|nr:hypothetical protein CF80_gp066 [Vibrio phage VH7D]ALP47317.1 hypothetical protein phiGrn1_0292 [Vibrio phage phi-Grn1]ALP47697.1 hypothetical protein phiST2_0049 [Vibrio phage phi-ST2]QBX06292.1 hypothetical protein Va3_339 [Vibrio phage Va3]QNJ55304.1 hypothetical protein vBValMR11Z_378 [Vibrio phage vB_ValM_R11Z]URQ03385.1 hypothetical protein PVA23_8 [Vibrio phage PVA23]